MQVRDLNTPDHPPNSEENLKAQGLPYFRQPGEFDSDLVAGDLPASIISLVEFRN